MQRDIKLAVVGCGKIASAHINGLKELKSTGVFDRFSVTALCSRKEADALRFRKRGEGPDPLPGVGPEKDPMNSPHVYVSDFQEELPEVFTDYNQMIREADIDGLLILTPVFNHHEIAFRAIEAGIHVLVEKPFAVSIKAGRNIIDRADEKGVVCGVAESLHYRPDIQMIRWTIGEGLIGTPQFFHFTGVGGFWSPDRIVAETAWRHKKLTATGGATVDSMVHFFHALRRLFGEVESVSAQTCTIEPKRYTRDAKGEVVESTDCEVDDTLSCSLRFANGATGNLFYSWAGRGAESNFPGIYYGSEGFIKDSELDRGGNGRIAIADLFERDAAEEVKERLFPKGIRFSFTLELLSFLRAVDSGGAMETSGREGLADLAVSLSALESSLLGRRIRVADVLSGETAEYEREINRHYGI